MVNVTGYAFPWDFLDDPEAAARAASLGVEVVALAASYHATRVVTLLHPTRRVRNVPYSALYVPLDDASWRGHRLIPRRADWLDVDHSFEMAQRALADVDLSVDAWLVLTHVDDVGNDRSDLVVRNAFDEPYPYALCPSASDVLEYCRTLVSETLRLTNCRGVVLEACGPLGFEHSGPHEKSEFARLDATDLELLSICFCQSCQRGLGDRGIDSAHLARQIRDRVGTHASTLEDALGVDVANEVAHFRLGLATTLQNTLTDVVRAARPDAPIALHASANRWATGSFPALGDAGALPANTTVVANCWTATTRDDHLRELKRRVHAATKVGGYVRIDQLGEAEAIDVTIKALLDAGMDELHLYHLGLVSRSSLTATSRAIDAFHAAPRAPLVRSEGER